MTEGASEQGRGVGGTNASADVWLAGSLWLATVSLLAIAILLGAHSGAGFFDTYAFLPVITTFATVGLVISLRLPRHPIGWLFCTIGLLVAVLIFLDEYATYALVAAPEPLSASRWAAWAFTWTLELSWGPLIFVFLLFPHGRLLSPRWRYLAWFVVGAIVIGATTSALSPVNFANNFPSIEAPVTVLPSAIARLVYGTYQLVLLFLLATSGACIILRFGRSRGEERQQLKWFTYTVAMALVAFIVAGVAGVEPVVVSVALFPLIPISVGIAVLRYRLYDIDLIINRTIVYGSLTVLLAAAYFGGVVGLQYVFRTVTGQESTLAVVASTLVIAALFNPLRRRVQAFVDRRFYRRKYDAAKTLAAFNARLREETDLEALSEDLVRVAKGTVQPEHVSLWLRPQTAQKGEQTG